MVAFEECYLAGAQPFRRGSTAAELVAVRRSVLHEAAVVMCSGDVLSVSTPARVFVDGASAQRRLCWTWGARRRIFLWISLDLLGAVIGTTVAEWLRSPADSNGGGCLKMAAVRSGPPTVVDGSTRCTGMDCYMVLVGTDALPQPNGGYWVLRWRPA